MKKPMALITSIIGWTVLLGIAVAILYLYDWNPIAAVSGIFGKVADFFLQFDWFRTTFS